ncbi:hypothetical protein OESDEN_18717 [Oesophagostomum dentatum]|uniref:GDNF/GAS1 domain protein n=1 Tax=Oesophagostomum dentatum TaxID=61180 RepID=A0A0B1SCJ1_OESDE|nr:hypothetical protein OESDEN_18717 [Oesophagostomum dentatum]
MATPHGEALESCTCTEREDQLCIHLRDNILRVCDKEPTSPSAPDDNSITLATPTETHTGVVTTDSAEVIFPSLLLCALLAIRLFYML